MPKPPKGVHAGLDPSRLKDCKGCGKPFYPPERQSKGGEGFCVVCTKAGKHHERFEYKKSLLTRGAEPRLPQPQKLDALDIAPDATQIDSRAPVESFSAFVLSFHRYIAIRALMSAERLVRWADKQRLINVQERAELWAAIDEADRMEASQ